MLTDASLSSGQFLMSSMLQSNAIPSGKHILALWKAQRTHNIVGFPELQLLHQFFYLTPFQLLRFRYILLVWCLCAKIGQSLVQIILSHIEPRQFLRHLLSYRKFIYPSNTKWQEIYLIDAISLFVLPS